MCGELRGTILSAERLIINQDTKGGGGQFISERGELGDCINSIHEMGKGSNDTRGWKQPASCGGMAIEKNECRGAAAQGKDCCCIEAITKKGWKEAVPAPGLWDDAPQLLGMGESRTARPWGVDGRAVLRVKVPLKGGLVRRDFPAHQQPSTARLRQLILHTPPPPRIIMTLSCHSLPVPHQGNMNFGFSDNLLPMLKLKRPQ